MKSNINFSTNDEIEYFNIEFIEKYEINCVGQAFKKQCRYNKQDIIKNIESNLDATLLDCKCVCLSSYHMIFSSHLTEKEFAVVLYFSEYQGNFSTPNNKITTLNIYLYADILDMPLLSEKFQDLKFVDKEEEAIVYVQWVCLDKQGNQVATTLKASENKKIKDAYYPWIPEGVDDFYAKYDASPSPILIILGPPGLGKSSLIRNYIYQFGKKTIITYDTELMKSDNFFINFIENEQDLIVLEDYDIFLTSRDETDNAIMNKFLNLSEGIVDIGRKKIIFTANIEKDCIDPALVRPGRCYDILEFKPYTQSEARNVIEAAGLSKDTICQDEMTLAEIFNSKISQVKKKAKVGFYS